MHPKPKLIICQVKGQLITGLFCLWNAKNQFAQLESIWFWHPVNHNLMTNQEHLQIWTNTLATRLLSNVNELESVTANVKMVSKWIAFFVVMCLFSIQIAISTLFLSPVQGSKNGGRFGEPLKYSLGLGINLNKETQKGYEICKVHEIILWLQACY